MSRTGHVLLLTVFILATSVWVGGYAAIVVVARTAAATLEGSGRVAFFRGLGRSYVWVGTPALVVAYVTGAVLARHHAWDAALVTTYVVALALLVLLGVAVLQARRMTRLRRRALAPHAEPGLDAQVRANARSAGILRGVLGLLTLVLVVLGAVLATG